MLAREKGPFMRSNARGVRCPALQLLLASSGLAEDKLSVTSRLDEILRPEYLKAR